MIDLSNAIEESINAGNFKKNGTDYLELQILRNPDTKIHTLFTPVPSVSNELIAGHYQKLFKACPFIQLANMTRYPGECCVSVDSRNEA